MHWKQEIPGQGYPTARDRTKATGYFPFRARRVRKHEKVRVILEKVEGTKIKKISEETKMKGEKERFGDLSKRTTTLVDIKEVNASGCGKRRGKKRNRKVKSGRVHRGRDTKEFMFKRFHASRGDAFGRIGGV